MGWDGRLRVADSRSDSFIWSWGPGAMATKITTLLRKGGVSRSEKGARRQDAGASG